MIVKYIDLFDPPMYKMETECFYGGLNSGIDLYARIENNIILSPGERTLIPTGLKVEIPEGYEGQIRPRSGLAIKNGLTVLNTPGTLDANWRGECGVILINLGNKSFLVEPKDRIAQLVICPVVTVNWEKSTELSITERGEKGFGSTGV